MEERVSSEKRQGSHESVAGASLLGFEFPGHFSFFSLFSPLTFIVYYNEIL